MSLAPRCRRRDLRNERSWQRPSGRLLGTRLTCFSIYAYWHCSRSNWINLGINPQTEYLCASRANRRTTTILACVGIIGTRPIERYDRRDDAIKRYVILTQRYSTRRDATRRDVGLRSNRTFRRHDGCVQRGRLCGPETIIGNQNIQNKGQSDRKVDRSNRSSVTVPRRNQ